MQLIFKKRHLKNQQKCCNLQEQRSSCLTKLALKQHVVLRRKTNKGAQQIFNALLLTIQGVDNGSTLGNDGCLQQVRQDGKDVTCGLESLTAVSRHLNALHQLGDDCQVKDQRRSQERVLASVVHHDALLTPHRDLKRCIRPWRASSRRHGGDI